MGTTGMIMVIVLGLLCAAVLWLTCTRRHHRDSIIRPILTTVSTLLHHTQLTWETAEGDGHPAYNRDRETGSFSFVGMEGKLSVTYEAEAMVATLIIIHDGATLRVDYVGGSVSSVSCDGELLPGEHWDVRSSESLMRKVRLQIHKQVGFHVQQEDEDLPAREFARTENRKTINYGRKSDAVTPRKKRRDAGE